ncbi:hypothetical protein DO97_17120 [Neosynechococcus sphagnicola sy1]|uniref:DDE transposase family protein n=1 Tax=Neosynechococcus sphagnicola sy1 TaxID=1497020 RepID=A0A098TI28_9CYAN|nr:hypothetical protein [Neosynechococcus sphagnicola]KGF71622.1 hypothetical protein DO97_17120 [Neosynechococcus sphagnicola sy1]
METSSSYFIVKRPDGHCEILPANAPELAPASQPDPPIILETWGPFVSSGEAIARRVGLIRAGKCQPL